MHNLFNALILGFSGNDLHAYMDRAAKSLRQNHRTVGHDTLSLIQMITMFSSKYSMRDILNTYIIHKGIDGWFSGIKAGMRKSVKGYGKKESAMEIVNKLKAEVLRL